MKYKTMALDGPLLDAAVAKAEKNLHFRLCNNQYEMAPGTGVCMAKKKRDKSALWHAFQPSGYWSYGGPIVEREKIAVLKYGEKHEAWIAGVDCDMGDVEYLSYRHSRSPYPWCKGPTALVASMRAHVLNKIGEEIELP